MLKCKKSMLIFNIVMYIYKKIILVCELLVFLREFEIIMDKFIYCC